MRMAAFVVRGMLGLLTASLSAAALAGPESAPSSAPTSEPAPESVMSAGTFAGLKLRSIGPALTSGRIGDLAVDPHDRRHFYVAVASGGVWKTVNAGVTWTPVFDSAGSYSIGCVTIDPANPHVVWVGTGENNSQRSVSIGDGVYRTRDGGATWDNLGLKESEHIGMICIDPRDSNVVYVAAQGPLWRAGGDRGLYKTTDGGATWERILHISDDTGVNDVHLDPRNPDVLYASSYQRRRHVWTLINGGPESAIYKSTDAGKTWRKVSKGLPEGDLGRIGLAVAPSNPDVVYAIVEATGKDGGVFRSTDRGESWEKRNDYMSTSPQYYNELVCDPADADHVYTLDTFMHETRDGGQTFRPVSREHRHVDDHALWIDPHDTDYMLVGCDGGLYETFDGAANWRFVANLPVTQFYRVTADNSLPFYFVYGGTQDNQTLGGPSRTLDRAGITNADWFQTVGGDGFKTQVDPLDPNIIYSQWQHAGLIRFDRRSGEATDVKPREKPGEPPNRWNWDSPLIISPHDHCRLYFGANRLFRSDDRGDSWTCVSPDLTRQLDRNQLEVMGRIQPADAVGKHWNTSLFGNIVALSESPMVEGLVYVGTDDGLIQVTEDGGANWRRLDTFPGVPEMAYVSCVCASRHDADTVYATSDNHKDGDFKPYVLRSRDRGRTWAACMGDLPARDFVYSIAEDHERRELLFVGAEYGAYFTVDGGEHWIKLSGGMPTISVREIDIQRRENDLVLATFGRGIYILDDYTPLREVSEEVLSRPAVMFPVKTALRYIEANRLGGGSGWGSQGASFYAAPNPPYGAVFTYYLKDKLMTRREARHEAEKQAAEAGKPLVYPTFEELRAEDEEREPTIVMTVRDAGGEIVRTLTGPRDKGIHRVAWDLRYPAATPTELSSPADAPPWAEVPAGALALPGRYTVTLSQEVAGTVTALAGPVAFEVQPLELATLAAQDRAAALAFKQKMMRLQRAVRGAIAVAGEAQTRVAYLRKAYMDTPAADASVPQRLQAMDTRLNQLLVQLRGNRTLAERWEAVPISITELVDSVVGNVLHVTTAPTKTHQEVYENAGAAFGPVLAELRQLLETDLPRLEAEMEAAGAPWTPGRVPTWERE